MNSTRTWWHYCAILLLLMAMGQSKSLRAQENTVPTIALPVITDDIKKRVAEVMSVVNSDEWQERYYAQQAVVADTLGIRKEFEQAQKRRAERAQGRLYIFVSKSVPLKTLRRYARDMEKLPGSMMVLRGFIGGARTMAPTVRHIAEIIKHDTDCTGPACTLRNVEIYVDPILFRQYNITRVPAVVYAPEVATLGHCEEPPGIDKSRDVLVAYGDAALLYVLETLQRERPHSGLKKLLTTFSQQE